MSAPAPPLQRRHFLARVLGALTAGTWLARAADPERAEAETQSTSPYIGEIKMFAGSFAPAGWHFCNGQLLAVDPYYALFSLIGTTYGGDGESTFALPDLRGRTPIHVGTLWPLGQMSGSETQTLSTTQIPAHSHAMLASSAPGDSDDPSARVPARNAAGAPHYRGGVDATLGPGALLETGAGQPHTNMQPYLCVQFIICWDGIYPTQS
jgi:microcystin-dependent protein